MEDDQGSKQPQTDREAQPIGPDRAVSARAHQQRNRRKELTEGRSPDTVVLLDVLKRVRWTEIGDLGNVIMLMQHESCLTTSCQGVFER